MIIITRYLKNLFLKQFVTKYNINISVNFKLKFCVYNKHCSSQIQNN